jgi:gluconolactonase
MKTRLLLIPALLVALSATAAEFDIRDEAEFKKLIPPGAKLERLATGMRFTEGPVWIPENGGHLIFSDIPANELKKWSATDGLGTFRSPSNNANGNTLDQRGRLITCEHGARRVSITEKDGSVRTLVDSYQGKRLNSPNDAVVKSDGTIWFTDPPYGIKRELREQPAHYVFRFDPRTGKLAAVIEDFDMPNGLCFSPDEKKLYVADSGEPHHIRVFDVNSNGTVSNGRIFAVIDKGLPDGIRADTGGRIWSSAGDGVQIFSPDGNLIGKILTPESAANLCFGGENMNRLYITARGSLYAINVGVRGLR